MTTGILNVKALQIAPDFHLLNHDKATYTLNSVMGEKGVLLVFVGDIWDLGCIRTTLWLQRQSVKLTSHGINAAIIVPNHTYDLSGYAKSMPRDMPFEILGDPKGKTYSEYGIQESGFVVVNSNYQVCGQWELKAGSVPHMRDIFKTIE